MPKYRLRTISDPEFINLSPLDINPLISKCEIKVFYFGPNRNKNAGTGTNPTQPATGEVGRKEKSDDEKSEKTIQNKESMN